MTTAKRRSGPLVVVETHPVQYHAPVYAAVQEQIGTGVTAIYGSDFSTAAHRDDEFQADIAWNTDLLSGYGSRFLSTVDKGGGRTYDAVSARGIARAIRDVKPSAILMVGYSFSFYRWAWLQALRAQVPVLLRAETTGNAQSGDSLKRELRDRILRHLYRRCTRLLYIGENSRSHFAALGCPEEKLVFSPYCVATAPFRCGEMERNALRTQARASLGVKHDEIVLLFSGKLSHRKGPDLLIEAAKVLETEHEMKIVVLFVGDGELRPALQAAADAAPRVKVRFAGFQNQRQLSPYYHAADLLVLPSRNKETWGLVVNEALHHGLPCIVSDQVGCRPDLIVPQTGESFPAGFSRGLAAAILRGQALVRRLEVRQWCRARVGGYTVEKAAAGIVHAYRSAVSN